MAPNPDAPRTVRRTAGLALALLLAPLLLPGCHAAEKRLAFADAAFVFRSVELRRMDLSGITFAVVLGVQNPNDFEATMDRLSLKFALDQRELAGLDSPRAVRIPPREYRDVTLEVRVGFLGLGGLVDDLRSSAPKTYRVRGTASFETALGRHEVPVDVTGRFR